MDELLHHCLRELSFDGDLGSSVSRLRDFIGDFYTHSGVEETVDDAFCAFVWTLLIQQPTVRVGVVPPGVTSEVWIAPQTSAKRKAKLKGEEHAETKPPELDLISEPQNKPLEELTEEFGDELRMAIHPDAIYAAITGSHIRFAKLSPMVYSALQVITRGRYDGISVVGLGQQSRYDQKTCFYLVRQLVDLDLVVKVRRGGVGTHFVIHKYFFDRSPSWQAIRDEELRADNQVIVNRGELEDVSMEDDERGTSLAPSGFTPIDSRHLSSLPLLRGRIVRLLKNSKNQMHAAQNLLVTIGFSNPTKTDRRFFQSRIRELIQQGVIEKVVVPSSRKKSLDASVKCFRLAQADRTNNTFSPTSSVSQLPGMEEDDQESGGVKINISIHKQIFDLLEEAGMSGMTLNDLSASLCQFDKRTIELLLTRAEKYTPPSHISDLGIVGLMETSGRERRHRYFTVAAYRELLEKEKLESSKHANIDLSDVGEFLPVDSAHFYPSAEVLLDYQDSFKDPTRNVGKLRKKPPKNPILPDGTVKKGRPRKSGGPSVERVTTNRKRSQTQSGKRSAPEDVTDDNLSKSVKKKRVKILDNREFSPKDTFAQVPQTQGAAPPEVIVSSSSQSAHTKSSRVRQRSGESDEITLPAAKRQNLGLPPSDNDIDPYGGLQARESAQQRSIHISLLEDRIMPPETLPLDPLISSTILETNDSLVDDAQEKSLDRPTSNSQCSKTKGSVHSRVNVSQLRRESEMLRILESCGGVVNIQTKEFYDAHMSLIDSMAAAGDPTSAPIGTRTDKRTAVAAFANLENRGKVKQLKTAVTTHTGVLKPACIIYLPTVSKDTINAFLADLARNPIAPTPGHIVKLDEQVDYGADAAPVTRGALPLQLLQMEEPGGDRKERWSKNASRAAQLFSYDDATIRDVLLTERTTLAQMYGFIVAKAIRLREFHLSALRTFEVSNPSSNIISHEHRILDVSFFVHDVPLDLYCTYVSALTHSDELSKFIGSDTGRKTLVKDLPSDLHFALQIGRSRARSRILDLLECLRTLRIVTPLQPSIGNNPYITCQPSDGRPHSYDIAPSEGWTVSTPMAAPTYWHFNDVAPLYIWGTSETSAPFWKEVPVADTSSASQYWSLLEQASLRPHEILSLDNMDITSDQTTISIARSLRRNSSWNTDYILTWHQMYYLKQYCDAATASTPLQDDDHAGAKISRISWVISAPRESVEGYYGSLRFKLVRDHEKVQKRSETDTSKRRKAAVAKASLAQKAAEAKAQREREWDDLIKRVNLEPLEYAASIRVKRVRSRFVQATSVGDVAKWEQEILDAIREADMTSAKPFKPSKPRRLIGNHSVSTGTQKPSLVVNSPEVPIRDLIAMQGPPIEHQEVKTNRTRSKKDSKDPSKGKPIRRHRFQWNRDFDELARDASAIIKARCRNLHRLDWAGFEQVFPAVPRNTVRQRLVHLKETPGQETYLNRLEDRWYELWMQHRGTPELPDDEPLSTSNFDLIKHIEFLRQHVDKNALRVGFAQPTERDSIILPSSFEELHANFDVVENPPAVPSWDFMWNAVVEEGREQKQLRQPFLKGVGDMPLVEEPSEMIALAEAAVKMTLGTPQDRYDADVGSSLLHSVGEHYVSQAMKGLLGRGVLSKLVRDPQKQRPGRQLKISEVNQNAIGGTIPKDTFLDAAALEDLSTQDASWRDWPLLATDGDTAALISMVSDGKLEFDVITTQAQSMRPLLDWNSKKADDDHIETSILVRSIDAEPSPTSPSTSSNLNLGNGTEESCSGHGQTIDGLPAVCRVMTGAGLVDCTACLEEEWTRFNDMLSLEERNAATHVLSVVRGGGDHGITRADLEGSTPTGLSWTCIVDIVVKMARHWVPMLFWAGYSRSSLVSSAYLRKWTVCISEKPILRIFPRRWLDVSGHKIVDFWEAALKAVMSIVIFRPGVSQAELLWRLRSVYDRQEVGELVRWLHDDGSIKMRQSPEMKKELLGITGLDDEEEGNVFWFVGNHKRWYQV